MSATIDYKRKARLPDGVEEQDFRKDEGGGLLREFIPSMVAARYYMDLPSPRELFSDGHHAEFMSLTQVDRADLKSVYDQASYLLRHFSPSLIAMMASSDIGLGTDLERLDERILNRKHQVLDMCIFPTNLVVTSLHESIQSVHTVTRGSSLSTSNKIDFGLGGGYQGVRVGFEAVNESSDFRSIKEVIGIADLRYQMALMECRIKHEMLWKYICHDCRDSIDNLNIPFGQEILEVRTTADSTEKVEVWKASSKEAQDLAVRLSNFIRKYGTHVVLKCTFGYRLEKIEKARVTDDFKLRDFKAGLMASALGYVKAKLSYQRKKSEATHFAESSLNARNIGPVSSLNAAMNEKINDWPQRLAGGGDAGVISHDSTMSIADILRFRDADGWSRVSRRLSFWTQVRLNDLRAGLTGDIFACCYRLNFCEEDSDNSVCVEIGGESAVHQGLSAGYMSNTNSYDVESITVCTLNNKKLSDVLKEFVLYRRFIDWEDYTKGKVRVDVISGFPTEKSSLWTKLRLKRQPDATNSETHYKLVVKKEDLMFPFEAPGECAGTSEAGDHDSGTQSSGGSKGDSGNGCIKIIDLKSKFEASAGSNEAAMHERGLALIDDARAELLK